MGGGGGGGGPGMKFEFNGGSFEDIFGSFFGGGNSFGFDDMFSGGGGAGRGSSSFGGGGMPGGFSFGGGDNQRRGRGRQSAPESKRPSRSPPKAHKVFVSLEDLMSDSFQTVRVKNRGSVEVEVPKGCPEGHVLEEQGMRFEVHSQSHDDYERRGTRSHLYSNMSISLEQALLGFNLQVMTLDGELIEETIDSVPPSMEFQLKNKGLPRFGKDATSRGHLYIHFDVELPTLTEDEREWLQQHIETEGPWDYSEARKYREKINKRKQKRNQCKNDRAKMEL